MKTILVVTNSKRRSLVFVSTELNTYSLEKAIQLTQEGKIDGAHIVRNGKNTYIRTNPKLAKSEEFNTLSVTIGNLFLFAHGVRITKVSPALNTFIELYRASLNKDAQLIRPVGQPEVLSITVKEKLLQHKSIIFDAAREFDIDPYLLGAILIDEIARLTPFEPIVEALGILIIGRNISVGIAQVKTDTANDLIKEGLYNPNPNDKKLPFKQLASQGRVHLYSYLIQPKHSIFFAGAKIRSLIDKWKKFVDLSERPEIIGTLYALPHKEPHSSPEPNERGLQISGEFYQLSKRWL